MTGSKIYKKVFRNSALWKILICALLSRKPIWVFSFIISSIVVIKSRMTDSIIWVVVSRNSVPCRIYIFVSQRNQIQKSLLKESDVIKSRMMDSIIWITVSGNFRRCRVSILVSQGNQIQKSLFKWSDVAKFQILDSCF